MNLTFSILHPTRGRPEQARKVCLMWLAAMEHPETAEYFIGVDKDCASEKEIIECGGLPSNVRVIVTDSHCSVECNNALAKHTAGKLLMMLQDDMTEPKKGWDLELLNKLPKAWDAKELVVGIACGLHNINGSHLFPHITMTRARYIKLGYFVYPLYRHTHADDHHTHLSNKQGVALDLRREICWKHFRGSVEDPEGTTGRTMDGDGKDGKSWIELGHDIYWNYAKPHIDATGEDLPLDFKLPK